MSHVTANDPPPTDAQAFADYILGLVRGEIGVLRSEIEDSEAPVALSEEQLATLAEKVAKLASLSPPKASPTVPTPTVPFSGGTPLKQHSTPRTAYSNRDSKTILKVEEMCLEGVKKGYTFSGKAVDLQPFLHLLETRAHELGFSEALYIVKQGEEHKLCTGGFNGVSIADTRFYEKDLHRKADRGDVNAARLIREHHFLRTVLRHSLSEAMDLSVSNSCEAEDMGATYLRQLLHQVQGSHGVSLKNAQQSVETKKLLDYPGCSMQLYMDDIKPQLVNLYFAKQLPIRCCYTVLQNLAGTMNDAFESVRLSKLGSLPEDMDIDTEYKTVIAVIIRLTTVYTDEHQSGKWQQSLKAAAAFQAKFTVDEKKDDSKESNKDKKKKKSKHAWKQKPPKEGSAETKKVDGKTWKWCAKCSRWTLSHSTSEHTGRPSNASNEESPTPPAETGGSLPAVGYYLL